MLDDSSNGWVNHLTLDSLLNMLILPTMILNIQRLAKPSNVRQFAQHVRCFFQRLAKPSNVRQFAQHVRRFFQRWKNHLTCRANCLTLDGLPNVGRII